MSYIKNFKIRYFPLNSENTFSAGDTVEGSVTFTLTSVIKIKCLYVMVVGSAQVVWGGDQSNSLVGVNAQTEYYQVKEILIEKKKDGTYLPSGDHCFKFKVQLPERNLLQSSDGFAGTISHMIVAKMSRSWLLPCIDHKIINLHSGAYMPNVKFPQMFSNGDVHLSATVDKRACSPGDTLNITAKIVNKTSKKLKIKCSLSELSLRFMLRGSGYKATGPTIEPGFDGDVSIPFEVPGNAQLGLDNSGITTLEFYLKVYLNVSFALNPTVVLGPLIITSSMIAHGSSKSDEAVGGPSSSDFHPPFSDPYPAAGPNAYPGPPPGVDQYSSLSDNATNAQFLDQTPPSYASIYPSTDRPQNTD